MNGRNQADHFLDVLCTEYSKTIRTNQQLCIMRKWPCGRRLWGARQGDTNAGRIGGMLFCSCSHGSTFDRWTLPVVDVDLSVVDGEGCGKGRRERGGGVCRVGF